jgi:hypothetical protein
MSDITALLWRTFDRGRARGRRDVLDAARRLFPGCDVDALETELRRHATPDRGQPVTADDAVPVVRGVHNTGGPRPGAALLKGASPSEVQEAG